MSRILQSLWNGWKRFARFQGLLVTNVVLGLVYLLVIPLFSFVRLEDPLRRKIPASGSLWEPMERVDATVEDASSRG